MARAQEMGFDTPVYHGTNRNFSEFKIGEPGHNSTIFGSEPTTRAAVFVAEHPDLGSEFSLQHGAEGARVMPLMANTGSHIDLSKQGFWQLPDSFFEKHGFNDRYYRNLPNHRTWEAFDHENGGGDLVKALQSEGYNSAKLQDMSSGDVQNTNSYAIFDPADLRSRTATFDPAKASSSNLLAARGIPSPFSPFQRLDEEQQQ